MAEVGVTKQILAYAMKDMMTRQPLSKITVGDVCQACGMNRKSFYYHYQDKYDLVAWIFRGDLAAEAENARTLNALMAALCRTMEKNVPFYRAALKEGGQNSLQECIAQELRPAVDKSLRAAGQNSRPMVDLFVDMYCFLLVRWVQGGCAMPTADFLQTLRSAAIAARQIADMDMN